MGSRLESNSNAVRKRIERHTFDNEEGDEYDASKFGGFGDYFRRKKIKLQNLDVELRAQSSDNPPIFRGVVAHVNGYTQPSLNDLHKLIVSHGGGFMQYLDGKTTVTHIIASSLTPKKAVEFRRYRIVKPAWVVDSVQAGKLLPWDNYRVVDEGAGQKILGFENGKVINQANTRQRGYRDQTDASWYTSQLRQESTSKSSYRPPFLSQTFPSPSVRDEIDDLPPSHQPQAEFNEARLEQDDDVWPAEQSLVTPPKCEPVQPEQPTEPRGVKRASVKQEDSPPKHKKMTAEEHNAILLSDPKMWKSTVVNPEFLEQYYRESRLHHLSTWKADLKSQLQAMAAERSSSQKAKQKRVLGTRRYILHVDFDSFFAAVSLKKCPQYKELPAVVAHGGGSGSEIASCNYPARKYGIKNGMWMKRAQDLCPDLKVLPYDFPAYEEASRAFYEAILATGGVVQSVSIDEALVDVSIRCIAVGGSDGKKMTESSIYREQKEADKIAQSLRDEVKAKTGCAVSVGIGPNILCAKLALRKAKPAGQHQIKPEDTQEFIGELEVTNLPGVAYSIGAKLEEIGIRYVKDIRSVTRERLTTALGPKTGEKIWDYSRGIDRTEVGDQVIRKSVSAEVNWGVRFANHEQADDFIHNLSGELHRRLAKENVKGHQLTMKIMKRSPDAPMDPPKHLGHGKCDTFNKSVALGVATCAKEVISKEALSILKSYGFSPGELRGIGLQMTKLEPWKGTGEAESSQRRLQFKTTEPAKPLPSKEPDDPIQDDIVTPKKPKARPDSVQFGSSQLNSDSPSRKPLNTLGTQFILPSQADPKVLEELPRDIRERLAKHAKVSLRPQDVPVETVEDGQAGMGDDPFVDRKGMPAGTILPNESQLDPETLSALPSDVRAEVLAFYRQSPGSPEPRQFRARQRDQTVLPQSPRKNRTFNPSKKPKPVAFPGLRKRGRPPKAATLAAAAAAASHPTLTQSNFVATKLARRAQSNDASTTETEGDAAETESDGEAEISTDFLDALPDDIRREVLEEQRRARLRKKGGLGLNAPKHNTGSAASHALPPGQRTLRLPLRVPRPTFTTRKLWESGELREAVKDWIYEFNDEGPYREDVQALGSYLQNVVGEERDMNKAVGLVKWFVWIVGEEKLTARSKWDQALDQVKSMVQDAVRARGLGAVQFD
ncbi:DNA damage repair protein Mus42 [Phyllosticta citrichinensis]